MNYDLDLIKTDNVSIDVKLCFGFGEYRAEIFEVITQGCVGLDLCSFAMLQAYECLPRDGYPDAPKLIEMSRTSDSSSSTVRVIDKEDEGPTWLNRYLIGFEVTAVTAVKPICIPKTKYHALRQDGVYEQLYLGSENDFEMAERMMQEIQEEAQSLRALGCAVKC